MLKIAVVGGGVAGATLAWRLAGRAAVSLFAGGTAAGAAGVKVDASSVSGGLVRGFETDPRLCLAAARGLAELCASPEPLRWSGYREIGSVYLLPGPPDGLDDLVARVEEHLPGSLRLSDRPPDDLPLRGLPAGTVVVVEKRAGHISPGGLRDGAVGAARAGGATVVRAPVDELRATERVVRAAGVAHGPFDAVVLATGAWTPAVLAAAGLPTGGLRTKQIQYSLVDGPAALCGLPVFIDDTSGLYGRPHEHGRLLLGLPCDRWDVDPGATRPDHELAGLVLATAAARLGLPPAAGTAQTVVAGFDCYHPTPGLALRPAGAPGVHTFTGGSGGAAKSALVTSADAMAALLAEL